MSNETSQTDLSTLTANDLRAKLAELNLTPASNKKADLLKQLEDALRPADTGATSETSETGTAETVAKPHDQVATTAPERAANVAPDGAADVQPPSGEMTDEEKALVQKLSTGAAPVETPAAPTEGKKSALDTPAPAAEAIGLDHVLPFRVLTPNISPDKVGEGAGIDVNAEVLNHVAAGNLAIRTLRGMNVLFGPDTAVERNRAKTQYGLGIVFLNDARLTVPEKTAE